MVVNCEEVWREVSNYLEGDIGPDLRAAVDEHLRGCKHCTAVMDGTRNVIEIYGDERMIEVPVGFDQRLRQRLEANLPRSRGTAFGWMVAAAAAILVVGSFEVANSSGVGTAELRSEHAQPGDRVPADLLVIVTDGRLFHVPGCKFIHDKNKQHEMIASDAVKAGYVPCKACLKSYVTSVAGFRPRTPDTLFLATQLPGSAQSAVH